MVKKLITIIAIIILVVIIPIFIVYSCSPASLMRYVNTYPISEIHIDWPGNRNGPTTVVKITGQDDIKLFLEKLDIKSWNIESIWGKKISPNLWIRINKDLLIGLYGSGEPYAYVELQGDNRKNYRIPPNIYDEIKDSLNKYENQYEPDEIKQSAVDKQIPTKKIQLSNITYLAAGNQNTFALTSDGELYGWGLNLDGNLGIGLTEDTKNPTKIGLGEKVEQIVPGAFTVALTENGEVYTWGVSDFGIEGDGRTISPTPAKVDLPEKIVSIGRGSSLGLAISESGGLYMWGWNYQGQRGDGTRINNFTPFKVDLPGKILDATGGYSHVIALLEDGSVYTWGTGFYGELGDVAPPVRFKPGTDQDGQAVLSPYNVKFDMKIKAIAAGIYASYALDEDGTLYSFGNNSVGQLGIADGKVSASSKPLIVAVPKKIEMIASGDQYAVALAEDGTLYGWGHNSPEGKGSIVGIGSSEKIVYEPQIIDIPGEITSISAGSGHTWVMTKEGTIFAWGANHYGQIKDGLPEYINVPTKIKY